MSDKAWVRNLYGAPVILNEDSGAEVVVSVAGRDAVMKKSDWAALPIWPSGVSVEEAREIHKIVREAAEPLGFRRFEVHYGDDSTGDPGVWVSFLLGPDYPTDSGSINRLDELASAVKTALFESPFNRLPYIRFRQEQTAHG